MNDFLITDAQSGFLEYKAPSGRNLFCLIVRMHAKYIPSFVLRIIDKTINRPRVENL